METTSAQMCEDLFALLGRIKAAMVKVAESRGLTPVQIGAMYAILHGENTMGKVAMTLHCDASNATGIIDRLVAHKLVVRQESEQDRRVKTLQLTAKGKQTIDDVMLELPEMLGCDRLTNSECSLMHTVIGKLGTV
jgi:DNA-binding MarR family transcriptional regulator